MAGISKPSLRALAEVLKYPTMTQVQLQTLPVIIRHEDVLAKAKTGTGKTLGFLIPMVEVILAARTRGVTRQGDVGALILSPTRELSNQICREAEALLHFHKNVGVQAVIGGVNMKSQLRRMQNQRCDIMVATPGRLIDHLNNSPGIRQRLANIRCLCLDECDQMLEMGFRPELTKIMNMLPAAASTGRQNLLFSATVPKAVSDMAHTVLKSRAQFIDTVGEDDEQTHTHIEQESLEVSWQNLVPTMMRVLKYHMTHPRFKVIVFFPTARFTQYMAAVATTMGLPVLEIHSRKSQSARSKASAMFLKESNKILFSSDVTARGMDYPGVTFVLQVGLTDREQYIHRLGRTARAGAGGLGLLLLADNEVVLLKDLTDVSISPAGDVSKCTGGVAVVGHPKTDRCVAAVRTRVVGVCGVCGCKGV